MVEEIWLGLSGKETHEDGGAAVFGVVDESVEESLTVLVLSRYDGVCDENDGWPPGENVIQCIVDGEGFMDVGPG